MQNLARTRYVPIIRTRDAELKGFDELDPAVKDGLLPVVEYTKSRRTPKNLGGALSVCVEKIEKSLSGRAYIADVTTQDAFGNAETHALLDQDREFRNWRNFVTTSLGPNCVPIVHLTDPLDAGSIAVQCDTLARKSGYVAVRVPPSFTELPLLATTLQQAIGLERVVLICDADFIKKASFAKAKSESEALLRSASDQFGWKVVASSGFPSSVVLPDYGDDAYGKFELLEVALSEAVRGSAGLSNVLHGDYALIHPADFAGVVTNWVPRVDVPLDRELFYHRYRRHEGGYIKAAAMAAADKDYVPLDCWGHRNIQDAAIGAPQGRSPAHWIAVRVNFHITRQAKRLGII